MPNLGGGKARCNLRDVPMVNSLFVNLIVTHVHMYTFQKLKLGGRGGGGAQTECTYYRGLENSQCT